MILGQNHFYRLPRELRDHIYWSYFFLDDGYTLNPCTGQLQTSQRGVIHLSFRRTSRLIADETRGLALKLNAIHVSTYYSHELRQRAGHVHTYLGVDLHYLTYSLQMYAALSTSITEDVVAFVKDNYPQFIPVIESLHGSRNTNVINSGVLWKEVSSLTRRFISSTVSFIATRRKLDRIMDHDSQVAQYDRYATENVFFQNWKPWKIPTENDIAEMNKILGDVPYNASRGEPHLYWNKEKYRFSAAATAVTFLNSLSLTTRLEIRKLVLHEDRASVAWPECHAQGLIPFCRENLNLHVERILSLWSTILPASSCSLFSAMTNGSAVLRQVRCDRVRSDTISRGLAYQSGIAHWIMEAMALPSLGMPANAFALVIDGELNPRQSIAVFDVVRRDAAWQTAFETCTSPWKEPADGLRHRRCEVYIMNGFPAAVNSIVEGSSIVRCNFDLGGAYSADQLVEDGRQWTLAEWDEKWRQQHVADFETEIPLLSWLDLRRADMLSE